MPHELANAVAQLSKVSIFDYFKKKSMPPFVEPLITSLVSTFATSSEIDRHEILSLLPRDIANIFGWYARKLAGRAVRNESQTDLLNGFVAVLINAHIGDIRNSMSSLALLYHSALRLRLDMNLLLQQLCALSTDPISHFLTEFFNRPTSSNSIELFHFHEGVGPEGFDYAPLLPEYGGPSPFQADSQKDKLNSKLGSIQND